MLEITEDGLYRLDNKVGGINGSASIIYMAGTLGSAVCKFVYFSAPNVLTPYDDEPLPIDCELNLFHGDRVTPYLEVTGAGGTDLQVRIEAIRMPTPFVVPRISGQIYQSDPEGHGSWGYYHWFNRFKGILPADLTIDETITDLTSTLGSFVKTQQPSKASLITYDPIDDVFRFSDKTDHYTGFQLELAISGDLRVTGSNTGEFALYITRPNGDMVRTVEYSRPADTPRDFLDLTVFSVSTFIFEGGSDPFQVDGFKLKLQKISGRNMTLEGQQELRFHA